MKKHSLWLIELLIWGLLIFSALFIGLYIYNSNIREKHTYYVFFHDVDGLIKGSPVKMLGYQVGHVSNISIVNEEVFITFIITDRKFKMPEKMSATVAFTGMGGSKSLELFVPAIIDKNQNYITVKEPKRLQDFFVCQSQIAQNIVGMTTDFMAMFNQERINIVKRFIKNPEIIGNAHKTLDNVQESEEMIMKVRSKYGKKQ